MAVARASLSFNSFQADDDRQPLVEGRDSQAARHRDGNPYVHQHHQGQISSGDLDKPLPPLRGLPHERHIGYQCAGLNIENLTDYHEELDTEPSTPIPPSASSTDRRHEYWSGPSPHSSSFTSSAPPIYDSYPPPNDKIRAPDFSPHLSCPSRDHMWKGRAHYIYVILLALSIFSTAFSGIYLGIAFARPQYQGFIDDIKGNLTYSNASLVFALFAKLTELSFITVFVAFVGQILSGRAFIKSRKQGITLAELSMRGWIMQPGTILTHFDSVRHVLKSVMGVLALLAALSAMLYTTAADALVSPQITTSRFKDMSLNGTVRTSFANITYIGEQCRTPVVSDIAGANTRDTTCLQIKTAADSYKNYGTWLSKWEVAREAGNVSMEPSHRPAGSAIFGDATLVSGAWVEAGKPAIYTTDDGRWVSNVSLAMPHAGVAAASEDPINRILQPQVKNNFGSFDLHASVPSPVINVMCVNMSADDMKPMVYAEWDGVDAGGFNWTNWTLMAKDPSVIPRWRADEWLNATRVDDLFGIGPQYGSIRPPVFPHLPKEYNTILNNTAGSYVSRNALWLLGAAPVQVGGYALCALRGYQTPACSTWYNSTSSGNQLGVECESPDDPLQYSRTDSTATHGNETVSLDWVDVASTWGNSVSLNSGITDGEASNARLLTQMIPSIRNQGPDMPTIAEALAVMASGTLLMSTQDAPFNEELLQAAPFHDTFKASIRSVQYASGSAKGYQYAFYAVLILVFLGNVLVLYQLLMSKGLVTDFADPSNLFALTINSPPSHIFAGSCGVGPDAKQYKARWYVNAEGDHLYISNNRAANQVPVEGGRRGRVGTNMELQPSPVMQTYSRLSKRRTLL